MGDRASPEAKSVYRTVSECVAFPDCDDARDLVEVALNGNAPQKAGRVSGNNRGISAVDFVLVFLKAKIREAGFEIQVGVGPAGDLK